MTDFDEVRRDWTEHGTQDPLWAVKVAPDKRGGRWDTEEFLATGRADVAEVMGWLEGLGLQPKWGRVLDFGCGAGRLSQALTAYADEVVGIDVSPPMLDLARRLDDTGRCTFVLNDAPNLSQFPDSSFDLVYSELVLQHLPAPLIDGYLTEFMRVLRPGGVAMLQCSTRPLWTFKGMIWRFAPTPAIRLLQRYVMRYPAPMRMTAYPTERLRATINPLGGDIIGEVPHDSDSDHWACTRYAVSNSR